MLKIPRAHERRRVLWTVQLQQGHRVSQGEAIDVSAWGAKVRVSERFQMNSEVVLTIAGLGSFQGEIRWQDDRYVGIGFADTASAIEDRLRGRASPSAARSITASDLEHAGGRGRREPARKPSG
jgi:PilZ domain